MNLLEETNEFLRQCGKSLNDVVFIQGNGFEISKEDFVRIASEFLYDDGFGHVYVPLDLEIVGDEWWLERHEYDGSECWHFRRKPERPRQTKKLVAIAGEDYDGEKYVYEGDKRLKESEEK